MKRVIVDRVPRLVLIHKQIDQWILRVRLVANVIVNIVTQSLPLVNINLHLQLNRHLQLTQYFGTKTSVDLYRTEEPLWSPQMNLFLSIGPVVIISIGQMRTATPTLI
jgi:hypothetical protein